MPTDHDDHRDALTVVDWARAAPEIRLVHVFGEGAVGGNPAPIVLDSAGLSDAHMQQVARDYGHESAFVLPPPPDSDCDLELRFWVPNHEMAMCGHATVGALWLLDHLGNRQLEQLKILTRSGIVHADVHGPRGARRVEITQPLGSLQPVPEDAVPMVLGTLGLTRHEDLAARPMWNACTSRVKTLVPLADQAVLDTLRPDFERVEAACDAAGSTGLYPYAVTDPIAQVVDARHFPRSSGYPEDPATGIAASALVTGLLHDGVVEADRPVTVRQGRAMGLPSRIELRFRREGTSVSGLWMSGEVRLDQSH